MVNCSVCRSLWQLLYFLPIDNLTDDEWEQYATRPRPEKQAIG